MGAPQIILIVWMIIEIVGAAATHGKEIKRNGGVNAAAYISILALAWWGGFFE